jgi:hypothetical protein
MGDCLTFHYDTERSGAGDGAPLGSKWSKHLDVNLGSAVRGAPLFVQNWLFENGDRRGQTHNVIYIATSDNHVNAYVEDLLLRGDAVPFWSVFLGPPVTRSGSNIPPPLGVTSSAVLDPANGRLFVCSYQQADGNASSVYNMYALDMDTGTVLQSATLHDPGEPGRPTFDASQHDQRGGLNLVNNWLYCTFAAFLIDDEGEYHGWVVGCNANNLNLQSFFSTTTNVYGGGLWGPGGAAADAGILYIATGNGAYIPANYWTSLPAGKHPGDIGDYIIGVVRLGVISSGRTSHLQVLDWFQPTNAQTLSDNDDDLGSSSCLLLPSIDRMDLLVVSGKQAIYLLNRSSLGRWSNAPWSQASVFPHDSCCAPAYYQTPTGDHYVYCSGGGSPGLVCYKVVVNGGRPSLSEVWKAGGGGVNFATNCSSPTIGSLISPEPYALVWVADRPNDTSGVLYAYEALHGTEVYHSGSADILGPLPHFPPVTCAGPSVYVGTQTGFAQFVASVQPVQPDILPWLSLLLTP